MKTVASILILFALFGCSHAKRAHTAGGGSSSEEYGPSESDANKPPLVYGPEPLQLKPVTLVFGPGMARGFAHVGVLRAFVENKIPIGAIYGTEMGGLVGAIYAEDSNINHFEWNLARLKDEIFTSNHGMLGLFAGEHPILGDTGELEKQLGKIFGKRDLAQAQIPLLVEVQKKADPSPVLLDKGSAAQVLRAAISGQGFFGAGTLDGQPAQAASDTVSVTFLCAEARARTGGPIILIDTAVSRNDPSGADLVIRPDLDGIAPGDFSKRTDAAFRGKKAIEEHLSEIKRWVGLSEGDHP